MPENRAQWLVECGWREGNDGLWRNDSYGGSWKLANAVREELSRPVRGTVFGRPALPFFYVTVQYENGERRGIGVDARTEGEAIMKAMRRKSFRNESESISWVRVSDDQSSFDDHLYTFDEIVTRLRRRA